MKNTVIKSILAILMAFMALPMISQNYLKIYFKDGHSERHFMHLVKNISMTKYDLEGNLHSDYQMQQIVMEDTTYSYYFADIDSMTFRKVDEEQLKALVETTITSIEPIFKECPTIEDLASHIDYIKNLEGVEDVYREGNDLVVQIRDWRTVFFSYPLIPDVSPDYLSEIKKSFGKNVKSKLPIKKDGSKMKVAIAFQMINDDRLTNDHELLQILLSHFNELGFETHFIPNEDGEILDTDFYENRIFDYDIVFLVTHGGYDRKNKKHYFYTSIKGDPIIPTIWEAINNEYDHNWDIDYTSVSSCKTGEGLNDFGYFKIVSEDLIKKGKHFTGPGPHIIFNTACKSLYGKDELTRANDGKTFKGSDAVAKIFFDKGADIYIGETYDQCHAMAAGDAFFSKMMDGISEESAFSHLRPEYKEEYDKKNSVLIDLINPNSEYNIQNLFFAEVHTNEKTEQEFNNEYFNKGFVELEGEVMPLRNIGVSCGFKWTDDKNIENLTNWENILISNNAHFSGNGNRGVAFSATLNSDVLSNYKPGQTIYYRAYTYDGFHYNYGEIWNFKMPDFPNLSLESNTIELTSGETKAVGISSGSGSYSIEKIEPTGIVTASISGNIVSIDAITAGTAKIIIKDDKSGKTATIEVTVTAGSSTSDGEIMMERKYFINTVNDYYHNSFYNPERFSYQEFYLSLDNDIAVKISYHNGYYWNDPNGKGSYDYSHLGIFVSVHKGDLSEEWYIAPLAKNEWVAEKIIIQDNGDIQYYMNGKNMGTHHFSLLSLAGAKTLSIDCSPYGWWYTHYHYMDDLKITTPANVVSDDFNDGVLDMKIWQTPVNPDGVREEDGILKMEQLRTDQDFHLRSKPIPVSDGNEEQNTISYLACPDDHHPHLIDLGLPSGTKWACCNVGANKPEDYGGYYAWGELKEKKLYDWSTYSHCDGTEKTCHDLGMNIGGTEFDVAHVKWEGSWKMPTRFQIEELVNNCTSDLKTMNGIEGRIFKGKKNGGTIFLPAAGSRIGSELKYEGRYGIYWSSTEARNYTDEISDHAFTLLYESRDVSSTTAIFRYEGLPIRPIWVSQ